MRRRPLRQRRAISTEARLAPRCDFVALQDEMDEDKLLIREFEKAVEENDGDFEDVVIHFPMNRG